MIQAKIMLRVVKRMVYLIEKSNIGHFDFFLIFDDRCRSKAGLHHCVKNFLEEFEHIFL